MKILTCSRSARRFVIVAISGLLVAAGIRVWCVKGTAVEKTIADETDLRRVAHDPRWEDYLRLVESGLASGKVPLLEERKKVIEGLCRIVQEGDVRAKNYAVELLGDFRAQEGVGVLLNLLRYDYSESPRARKWRIRAGGMQQHLYWERLYDDLPKKAVEALVSIGEPAPKKIIEQIAASDQVPVATPFGGMVYRSETGREVFGKRIVSALQKIHGTDGAACLIEREIRVEKDTGRVRNLSEALQWLKAEGGEADQGALK